MTPVGSDTSPSAGGLEIWKFGGASLADAARDNDLRAVQVMLAAGWPVDVRGQHRATPLHWAAWHGNV